MFTLAPTFSLAHLLRRILATRIITPAQEYQLNQMLWQQDLTPMDAEMLEKLLQGLANEQIIVLGELGRTQTLKKIDPLALEPCLVTDPSFVA